MTALKPLGSAQREISLRHSLFEEAIALVRNSAVGVLVTAIQVIAGSACRNFSPPGPFLHSGLRPHFKKGLAVVHLGAETAPPCELCRLDLWKFWKVSKITKFRQTCVI